MNVGSGTPSELLREKLYIVTPLSRPKNLWHLYLSIMQARSEAELLDIKWFVVVDSSKVTPEEVQTRVSINPGWMKIRYIENEKSKWGMAQRNAAMEQLTQMDGWVYFLDDDTILHHDFVSFMDEWFYDAQEMERVKALVFSQEFRTGHLRLLAAPDNVKVGSIDMGQVLIHTSLIGETRFALDQYISDGIFIEEIYKKQPGRFRFIGKALSIYNALR